MGPHLDPLEAAEGPFGVRGVSLKVKRLQPSELHTFDVLLFPVGYEERSVAIARMLVDRVRLLGIGFGSRKELSFDDNLSWVRSTRAEYLELPEVSFFSWLQALPANLPPSCRRLAIDISSFSRDRLGALIVSAVDWLGGAAAGSREVALVYSPGKFSQALYLAAQADLISSAELLPGFEGDFVEPDSPLTVILGLGYEPGRALGVIELLEPQRIVAFVPRGDEREFDRRVEKANRALLDPGSGVARYSYDVSRPDLLFEEMSRLVSSIGLRGRCVLVPLGPKLFAAVACLVGLLAQPRPPVWRVSGAGSSNALQSVASGKLHGLTVSAASSPDVKEG